MKKSQFPYHLLAAAAFPLLFLYANNLEYVTPVDLVRPLVVSLLLLFALWGAPAPAWAMLSAFVLASNALALHGGSAKHAGII